MEKSEGATLGNELGKMEVRDKRIFFRGSELELAGPFLSVCVSPWSSWLMMDTLHPTVQGLMTLPFGWHFT